MKDNKIEGCTGKNLYILGERLLWKRNTLIEIDFMKDI